jgi:hypothetical protein
VGAEPFGLAPCPQLRDFAVEDLEAVGHLGRDEEFDLDTGCGRTSCEEQGVIEVMIAGPNAHETWGKATQVREGRRDVRRSSLTASPPKL